MIHPVDLWARGAAYWSHSYKYPQYPRPLVWPNSLSAAGAFRVSRFGCFGRGNMGPNAIRSKSCDSDEDNGSRLAFIVGGSQQSFKV